MSLMILSEIRSLRERVNALEQVVFGCGLKPDDDEEIYTVYSPDGSVLMSAIVPKGSMKE